MLRNRIIIIFIFIVLIVISIYLFVGYMDNKFNNYTTGLSSVTIKNVEMKDETLIVDGYLHNSITVFSGHDYRIVDDCMYITIKVNTNGKAKEGIKGGSIHFEVVIPDYVNKVYLEDKNSNKIIYQKDIASE